MRSAAAVICFAFLFACAESADEGVPMGPQARTASSQSTNQGKQIIHVDDDAQPGGDGSGTLPFDNIADALALATSSSSAVVVVAPGQYPLSATLRIQSSVELRGSNVMTADDSGRPTGSVVPETETRILGTTALGTNALVSAAPAGDGVVYRVVVRNFTFDSGPARGDDINFNRVQDYSVYGNTFRGLTANGIFSVASSGRIVGNYISVDGTATAIAAGYQESPSSVEFTGNRVVNNVAGLVLIGSTSRVVENGDKLNAVVRDNDLSDNNRVAGFSFGLRIFTINRPLGNTQSIGNVKALIVGNRIANNQIGVTIDAGFPFRRVGTVCDNRMFSGSFDLDFRGNAISGSVFMPALITFTRNQAALNQFPLDLWQYLHSATFNIADKDGTLAGAVIDHPAVDPLIGVCPGDAASEVLNNTLIYNGVSIPAG